MNYQNIKCKSPNIILNPSLMNLLSIHRKFYINGLIYDVTPARLAHYKFEGLKWFRDIVHSLKIDEIDN